jgi:hypothetical protein
MANTRILLGQRESALPNESFFFFEVLPDRNVYVFEG